MRYRLLLCVGLTFQSIACGPPEVVVASSNARVVSTISDDHGVRGVILEAIDPRAPLEANIATADSDQALVFSTDGVARLSDAEWVVGGTYNEPSTTYQLDLPGEGEHRVVLDPNGSSPRRLTVMVSEGVDCGGDCAAAFPAVAWILVRVGLVVAEQLAENLVVKIYENANCPNLSSAWWNVPGWSDRKKMMVRLSGWVPGPTGTFATMMEILHCRVNGTGA